MVGEMPLGWSLTTLGDCSDWYSGGTPNTEISAYWGGTIPWITASSLHDFYVTDSERRVTELGIQNGTRLMPRNTILFVVRGMSLKSEFRVGISRRPVTFGQDCKAIIAHRDVEPLFLANVLRAKAPEIMGLVDEASHGTGRLQTEALKGLEILLPPLPAQRAIAHILGSLDDKIELNRRMNATLEEMARALFQAWFVDFAPVRAKMEGRAPGLPDEVTDLVPAALVASEVGEIPEGWSVVALPDAIEVNPSRSLAGIKSAPYLDMASMPTRGHRPEQWIERAVGSGMRFNNGDTLVARITPCLENGKTAFVDFLEDGQVGWGSTEYIVLRPKEPLPPPFAYYLARTEGFRTFAIQNMTGSSGRQRVPAECLKQFLIVMPPAQLAQRFGELAWGFMARIRVNSEQIKTLAALRDALLPKLVSGEVRIHHTKLTVETED